MLAAAAVSLVLFAAVPLAAWAGLLSVGLLVGVALLTGTSAVFFQTAYTAYLPTILAPEDQPEGNAKLHGSASAAQIAGLGSGGLIAQLAGAVNGMFANAATFLVSLLCLSRIRHREPRVPRTPRPRGALASEVGEGLRLVARDPWLRTLTLFGAASNLALMGYQSILVVFLVRTVGLDPGPVGGLVAAAGTGGVAGAFAARRVAARLGTARATLVFELGLAVFALLIPLTVGGAGCCSTWRADSASRRVWWRATSSRRASSSATARRNSSAASPRARPSSTTAPSRSARCWAARSGPCSASVRRCGSPRLVRRSPG